LDDWSAAAALVEGIATRRLAHDVDPLNGRAIRQISDWVKPVKVPVEHRGVFCSL
jgi:hypothetical protein